MAEKTRLVLLLLDVQKREAAKGWKGCWAGVVPLPNRCGWTGTPIAVYRLPKDTKIDQESQNFADTPSAATRSVHRWLREHGAERLH